MRSLDFVRRMKPLCFGSALHLVCKCLMVCLLAHWDAEVDAAQRVYPLLHLGGPSVIPSAVLGGPTVEGEKAIRDVFVCTRDHMHEIFQLGRFKLKMSLPCGKVSVGRGNGWTSVRPDFAAERLMYFLFIAVKNFCLDRSQMNTFL